ncbi:hypothetical protein J8N54_001665 [Salmonella enterica]|nr:hypothetical protein [Salmonella enterica]EHH5781180.1 hypothetical protein [Salmonella enterica]ELE3234358.1 hypothetical protein [Salmonella enterica subsp. enterica serovar Pomona]
MKSKLLLLSVLCSTALLAGCGHSMQANQVRLKLDECSQAQLNNIVYMRPDKSVLNVICTPRTDEINNPVTVKHPLLFAASPSHEKPTVTPLKPAN